MVKMTVDAMGDHCPIPVVKTKKALGKLQGAGQIEVLVDNETAMKNVMKMAKSSGASAESEKISDREYKVMITVEGSDCLEDIRILEKEGVEILTCGTCLDFYGLKEKLAVGAVTNMYTIAEILQNAVSVVSP